MRLLLILLLTTILFAQSTQIKETITIPTDTSGPIALSNYFTDSITLTTDTNVILPAWRFYKQSNQLRFEHPVPAKTKLHISYFTSLGTLKRSYSRYIKGEKGAVSKTVQQLATTSNDTLRDESIKFSGEKGITFSTGSSGGTSIEQTLDVSLSGKISEDISISGHLSDQSTSLQGDSKEVGELDRIYLRITGKEWSATVGDIEKKSLWKPLLEKSQAPKGGSFTLSKKNRESEIFGGISGSKQASQSFIGVSGIQSGIYNLTGENSEGAVYLVNNSVTIKVDGKKLTEGKEDGDFYVDYENSAIAFTTNFPIENGQRIEVQYEYKNSEYEKFTLGGSHQQIIGDSTLLISGAISVTGDNFESNERSYNTSDLKAIKNAGDKRPYITSGKKVHPKDILKEAVRYRLYQKDTLTNRYVWEVNPASVGEAYPLYIVQFLREETTEGEYLPYSTEARELFTDYNDSLLDLLDTLSQDQFLDPVYLFVGAPLGTHTPSQKAILPERTTLGELSLTFTPSKQLKIYTGIIGKEQDKNTQSDRDDNNNTSGYIESFVELSTDVNKMLVTSSKTEFQRSPGTIEERKKGLYTLQRTWGFTSDTSEYLFWKEVINTKLEERLYHNLSIGQLYVDNRAFANIVETKLQHQEKKFTQLYSILLRNENEKKKQGHRQQYSTSVSLKPLDLTLLTEEEWFTQDKQGRGYIKGEATLDMHAFGWKHQFKKRHDRIGTDKNYDGTDSSITTLWSQNFAPPIKKNHRFELHSTIQKVKGIHNKSLLLLYGIRDNYSHPTKNISSKLHLSTSMESALEKRWEYLPVPKGTGTHIKDSLTGTYISSDFGDYIAKEVTLFGSEKQKTVRNDLNWNWSIKKRSTNSPGDGLRFSGTLRLLEDITPKREGISEAWIPSFTTFSNTTKDSLIYSYISYTQKASWLPPLYSNFYIQNATEISQKISRGTNIKFIKGSNSISKGFDKLSLQFALPWLLENRAIYQYETILREFLLEPTQEVKHNEYFSTALTESIGHISIDETMGTFGAFKPALIVTTDKTRKSTLSYTAGYVDFAKNPIYPLAKEFRKGLNHRIALNLNLKLGKLTTLTGFLRADHHNDTKWLTSLSLNAIVKIK